MRSRKEKKIVVQARFKPDNDSTFMSLIKKSGLDKWWNYSRYRKMKDARKAVKDLLKNKPNTGLEFRIKEPVYEHTIKSSKKIHTVKL